jgi:hypothetical protein
MILDYSTIVEEAARETGLDLERAYPTRGLGQFLTRTAKMAVERDSVVPAQILARNIVTSGLLETYENYYDKSSAANTLARGALKNAIEGSMAPDLSIVTLAEVVKKAYGQEEGDTIDWGVWNQGATRKRGRVGSEENMRLNGKSLMIYGDEQEMIEKIRSLSRIVRAIEFTKTI